MADIDKNILIIPNVGQLTEPTILLTGKDNNPITLRVLDNNTLSFEGSAGQLFSISPSLTGTLFSVNDISGIPSIEVDDTGEIRLAEFSGNVGIGMALPQYKLDVDGTVNATAFIGPLTGLASSTTKWATGRTITLTGDVTGTSVAFDGSANLSFVTTVADDSHNHIIGNVDGLQTALDLKTDEANTLTFTQGGGITVSGSATAYDLSISRAWTISHTDTSTQASLTALTGANVVSDIDLDTYGHVTNLSTRALTLANLGYTGSETANDYSHPTTEGNRHIPSGGVTNNILRWSSLGSAVWGADNNTTYTGGTGLTLTGTSFAVDYGTAAGTSAQGNDSRLSDARTPVSHVHGNISNTGAIGVTANLPILTTTSGVLTAKTAGIATQYLNGLGAWGTPPDTIYTNANAVAAVNAETNLTVNAATATKWLNGRTITLTGDVTGTSGAFDGSGNLSIATVVGNNSHTHTFANLTSKPTTISGYSITDAMATAHAANAITSTNITNWGTAYTNTHTSASDNQTITSGSGMNFTTGSGNVTITMGTPSTLSASTTNAVSASGHTHAITKTIIGAASTLVSTDTTGNITAATTFNMGAAASMVYNAVSKTIDFNFA